MEKTDLIPPAPSPRPDIIKFQSAYDKACKAAIDAFLLKPANSNAKS